MTMICGRLLVAQMAMVRRLLLGCLAVMTTLGCTLLAQCAPAFAGVLQYPFLGAVSGISLTDGSEYNASIAVDDRSHDLLVVGSEPPCEAERACILVFDSSHTLIGVWTGASTPNGSFGANNPYASIYVHLAVDNDASSASFGDVYVADASHRVVDVLDSSGAYLGNLTGVSFNSPTAVAVDQATGTVYVGDDSRTVPEDRVVDVFSPSGVFQSQIAGTATSEGTFAFIASLAADNESHDVYVGDSRHPNVVEAFDSTGSYLPPAWTGANTPHGSFNDAAGPFLAANAGNVFVTFGGEAFGTVVDQFSSTGAYMGQITETPSGEFHSPAGVAVDPETGDIYVVDTQFGHPGVIDIFAPGAQLPIVTSSPAPPTPPPTSIMLAGTVNPNGLPVSACQFEYVEDSAYEAALSAKAPNLYAAGKSAPCAQSPAQIGSGEAPVAVSANLTPLVPNTIYHFRLSATNGEGVNYSVERVFKSGPLSPTVDDQPAFASDVTQFSATLHGTINPGNAPAAYHFLYGLTEEYESAAPTPDLYAPVNYVDDPVSQAIVGLRPGSTYHFALVASGPGGTVRGPDETFTTPPIPTPAVSTGGASAVTQGEATLAGTIDPHGWDTEYHFEYGSSAAYGSDWPTVDASLGAPDGSQPVTIRLQNLLPGSTYHYRLVATDGGGASYGADQTFTTEEYPQSVIREPPIFSTFLLPSAAPAKRTVHTTKAKCKRGYKLDKRRRCRRVKSKGSRKGAHRKRR